MFCGLPGTLYSSVYQSTLVVYPILVAENTIGDHDALTWASFEPHLEAKENVSEGKQGLRVNSPRNNCRTYTPGQMEGGGGDKGNKL